MAFSWITLYVNTYSFKEWGKKKDIQETNSYLVFGDVLCVKFLKFTKAKWASQYIY